MYLCVCVCADEWFVSGRMKGYSSHIEMNPQLTVMSWIVCRNRVIQLVTISPVTFQQITSHCVCVFALYCLCLCICARDFVCVCI